MPALKEKSPSSENFYKDLPAFKSANGVSNPDNFKPIPKDWVVVLTDVRGSTKAIEEGRYKDVNIVGASTITAVLNALKGFEIPYVFGGDGATLLVPRSQIEKVKDSLADVQRMSKKEFNLELRIACVPIEDVVSEALTIQVGKYAVSDSVCMATFSGGGLAKAEALVKDASTSKKYDVVLDRAPTEANFEGLECRWQPLESGKGEMISVLIKALASAPEESFKVYKELIEEIELIAGQNDVMNPVNAQNLKTQVSPQGLRGEQKVRTSRQSLKNRAFYLGKIWLGSLYGLYVFAFRIKNKKMDWGRYKDEVITHTDFWKYDDMLRFVIDVTPVQKRALVSCFEARAEKSQIAYGLHSSNKAFMTCLVFNRAAGNHVHFIDGGDGGYALAAKDLKTKLKDLAS